MRIFLISVLLIFVGCSSPERQLSQVEKQIETKKAKVQEVQNELGKAQDELEDVQIQLRKSKNIIAESEGKKFIP